MNQVQSIRSHDQPGRMAVRALALAVLVVVAGCATPPKRPQLPEPLRAPNPELPAEALAEVGTDVGRSRPRVESGPSARSVPVRTVDRSRLPDIPRRGSATLTLDGVTLSAFVNEVFGTQLGFSLDIDQAVRDRTELVSLRLVEPESAKRLYVIAEEVLRNYGVRVLPRDGLLRIEPGVAEGEEPPRLVTGRALPQVPAGQRPVFVAMPLNVSEPGRVSAQVRGLFGAVQGLTLSEMVEANAVLISGPPESVQAAMEAIALFDQVALRDKQSVRINPLYLGADVLAEELRNVLLAQGYSVRLGTGGAITLVPVVSANALLMFSESPQALAAATDWAERLDQPSDASAGDGGVYIYAARHTTVETLVPVLEALLGTGSSGGAATSAPAAQTAEVTAAEAGQQGQRPSRPSAVTSIGGEGGQLAVDPLRNVIVFQGDARRWRAIQGVLARLDQPARQVLIEVTVAEVSLTDEFSHGVEWALRNISVDGFGGPLTALAGAAVNQGGVVWRPISSSGQVSAVLNLFASDSRVSILSTPRLLVKSGESASIDVGTEVPIVTSQATAPDLPIVGDRSSILQQIQYRKTGVLLELDAVVHSGQRVDLNITQEVSEATSTDTSEISSPSIFSRRLKTSLTLSDGESMLLGGLISSSRTDSRSKVPLLGDVPLLGKLFQNRRQDDTRTELLMLITPYVIEDASQARAITDAVRARFTVGEQP